MTDRFKELPPREHFLKRPNVHIGSTEAHETDCWVLDDTIMQRKRVLLCEGLKKIIDEITQNAMDNFDTERPGKPATKVALYMNDTHVIVCNNGRTIPFDVAKGKTIRIPEMVFSRFGSGSNFDDDVYARSGAGSLFRVRLSQLTPNKE